MADTGLPAPPALQAPIASQPSTQPVQPPLLPAQPIQLVYIPQLIWSHFKPKFTGIPEEDADTDLLRTNDSMDTYTHFKKM